MRHRVNRVHREAIFRNTTAFLVLAALIAPGLVSAQDYKNPERRFLDAIGVSITEGIYHRELTPLTIGDPATGGLAGPIMATLILSKATISAPLPTTQA